MGHSAADLEQVRTAVDSGFRHMVHFYSAMSTVRRENSYRIPGMVEAGYLSKVRNGRRNVYVVHPELHLRHPLERETEIRVLLSIVHAGGQPRIPVEGAP